MIDWAEVIEWFLRGIIFGSTGVFLYSMTDGYKAIKDINKRIDGIEKILKNRE